MEVRKFAWQPVLILIPQPHEPLRSPRCLRGPPPQVSSLEEVLDSPSKSFLPSASSPPMVPRGHGGGGGGGAGADISQDACRGLLMDKRVVG